MIRGILCATVLTLALGSIPSTVLAQSTDPVEFDVVSIKPSDPNLTSGGIRRLPDGTFIMSNQPIRSLIMSASPVDTTEIDGVPDWMNRERYDVTVKPPAGTTPEQTRQMWQAMFADRMKLQAHIEQRERDVFALVLARADGTLGPQLKPSTLDCGPRPKGSAPPPPPPPRQGPPTKEEFLNRCGMLMSGNAIISGGIAMDSLVRSLRGLAGGPVTNRTGLQGYYALTLEFARPAPPGVAADAAPANDLPNFFTALQEQLGLKLQHEKAMLPVFVIDHIERPTAN
jgi:uncharacterized protein (TIGR03435 family)